MTPPGAEKLDHGRDGLDSGKFRLDRVVQEKEFEKQLFDAVLDLPEAAELKVVLPYLYIDRVDTANGRFNLVVRGIPESPLVFNRIGNRFELDKAAEESLVSNPKFYKYYYLEGLRQNDQINKYFEDLVAAIRDIDEDRIGTFFSDLRSLGLSFRVFGGSVPDADLKALVLGKKFMLLARLGSSLEGKKSLKELAEVRHQVFDPVLLEMARLTRNIQAKSVDLKRRGKDWSAREVDYEVTKAVLSLGANSAKYSQLQEAFVSDVFEKVLSINSPASSDFNSGLQALANYAYFTGSVDSPGMDKINYSKLGGSSPDKDSLDGLKRVQYCEYVHRMILETFPKPNPKIKEFAKWDEGVDLVGLTALGHDESAKKSPEDLTPLETEFMAQLSGMLDLLSRSGALKYSTVASMKKKMLRPSGSGLTQVGMEVAPFSGLSRQEQVSKIQARVSAYADFIFATDVYWQDISMRDRLKAEWHKLVN
ncbi:hypothetical protein HY605_05300 [Candidatus Peregrinibacteria bacterium]|nr:hypothetical protein [Candidatus Peregrinibacteria bacterium]